MKIRVFVSDWSSTQRNGRYIVSNPVIDYLNTITEPGLHAHHVYPDNDATIKNKANLKHTSVLSFVIAGDAFNFTPISLLSGVVMLPTNRPIDLTSNISQTAIDNMNTDLSAKNIAFTQKTMWGDTIREIVKGLNSTRDISDLLTRTSFI